MPTRFATPPTNPIGVIMSHHNDGPSFGDALLEEFSVMELEERFEFAADECCSLNGDKCNTGGEDPPPAEPGDGG